MRKYILILICFSFVLLSGCKKSQSDKASTETFRKIDFTTTTSTMNGFALAENSSLYVLNENYDIVQYKHDGTLLKEIQNTSDFTTLCTSSEFLYAYDAIKHQLLSFDTKTTTSQKISDSLDVSVIRKMIATENSLYLLTIPSPAPSIEFVSNGYINSGEVLLQVDLKTGDVKDTGEENILAIYLASNGTLYYYAYRDDTYSLFSYSTKNSKSKRIHDMSDVGYISAFVYEGDYFVYSDSTTQSVNVLQLADNRITTIAEDTLILSGNDMAYLEGNVLYRAFSGVSSQSALYTYYLGDLDATNDTPTANTAQGNEQNSSTSSDDLTPTQEVTDTPTKVVEQGKITVSTSMRAYLDPEAVKKRSGIRTKLVDQTVYQDAFLAEIMAGNPNVDIYITAYASSVTTGIRDKNIYVPLNDSDIITNHLTKCFDYVADSAKSSNGDVWMLPLSLNASAIWYVPENLNQSSITTDDFLTLDSFFSMAQRTTDTGAYSAYLNYPSTFCHELIEQYDYLYNDYSMNKILYNTEQFKELFDRLYSGWIMYSQTPTHPLFKNSTSEPAGEFIWDSPVYDTSSVLYKWSSISDQLNTPNVTLDGWRALPSPHITTNFNGNVTNMIYAFINPYSENKDLALKYLEAITEAPFDYMTILSPLMFEDTTMYELHYDINQPAFTDIYQIMKNGILLGDRYSISDTVIDDYQNNRLSIEETIHAIQREAEMWLNE